MKHSPYIIFLLIFVSLACSFSRGRGVNQPGGSRRVQTRGNQTKEQQQSRSDETSDTSDTTSGADLTELSTLIAESKRTINVGDKSGVERIYTDDYSGVYDDGVRTTKQDLLDRTQDNASFKSVKVDNAKLLSSSDSTAEVSCDTIIKFTDKSANYRGTYTFVKSNGTWQISGWRGSIE